MSAGRQSKSAAKPRARHLPTRRCAASRRQRKAGTHARSAPRAWRWRLWAQIKDLDWSLVSSSGNVSGWPNRLWPMEKHYHWLGRSGGSGVGYGAPASIGAALANRDLGRFSVSIQADGDLMYAPGSLWTAE